MNNPAIQQVDTNRLSPLPSRTNCWENVRLEHSQNPVGEGSCHFEKDHVISMTLVPRPVRYLQRQDGKTYTGLYSKGDLSITPANMRLFARWESDENYLQIRIASQFLQNVARETVKQDCDRLELQPEFRTRNPQIEAIGMMFLTELQQESSSSKLYIDSLANILAVNLLKQHVTTQPQLPIYEGGLPQHQLLQILDYIDIYLDRDIKLTDLAQLLDMSQFHFIRLFKQSIGISPYQYLIQQRVERAKQLLKQTDRLITDIALECGFNSHSHLSKRFRQLTGMTPKAYRAN